MTLDTLWMDPDPDTAGWVLMVERLIRPEIVAPDCSLVDLAWDHQFFR